MDILCYKDEKTGVWNKEEKRTFINLTEMQKNGVKLLGKIEAD